MISKKRYYGLALPIWECADCDAWEVIGSRDELRERAVAGWDEFDGHSPHRPWIDAVEIACPSCGGRARRIADVGNPWLDAGIVGSRTLGWTTDRDYWAEWYPGRLRDRVLPGPVPQLVLRPADDVDGHDRPGADAHALRLRAAARRARRGDAQEQGQRHLRSTTRPSRSAPTSCAGCSPPPTRRTNLNFGYRPGPRGRAPLLPAAVEHVRLLRHLRAASTAGRRDADRWGGGGADPARPMDPVAPRRRWSARCAPALDALRRDARRAGRSRASSTSSRTGTCVATGGASGRASSTPTSERPTPLCTRC